MADTPAAMRVYRALTALVPLAAPLLKRRFVKKGGDPTRWPERLGRDASRRPEDPLIWVHAVSVGEMMSALPLIDALHTARPDAQVLLTTTTGTSAAMATARLPDRAMHRMAPFDTVSATRRFLDTWKPERAVFIESELWPTQIGALHERGISLALVSARLTERSAARWARRPALARWVFSRIGLILAQDEATASRARDLGATRVEVTGSLKSAAPRLPVDSATHAAMVAALDGRPIWIAASTHAGEEGLVAEAHAILRKRHPGALLILAPRHPERRAEITAILGALPARSDGALPRHDDPIYLADTLGELGLWFSLAETVFLGGALRPGIGGHNPLEPAAFGCHILTGPHTANAEAEFTHLIETGQAGRVDEATSLAQAVAETLGPPRPAPRAPDGAGRASPDLAATTAAAVLAL